MTPMNIAITSVLVIALILLAIAFFVHLRTQSFLKSTVIADGEVIELVHSRAGGMDSSFNSTTYKPRVQFQTQSGETIEFTSSSGSSPARYSKGEKVNVVYSPSNPQEATIRSFFSLRGIEFIFALLGLIFLLVGILLGFIPPYVPEQ